MWNVGKPKTEGVSSKVSALPHVDDFVQNTRFGEEIRLCVREGREASESSSGNE